jgi:hypothetical protein
MKTARDSSRKAKVNFHSDVFTLSSAKTFLGRLVEKARKGEPVYIVRGQHRFLLQEVPPIDPIPLRPPGYFANSYSEVESKEANRLAKASSIRPPKDLELRAK